MNNNWYNPFDPYAGGGPPPFNFNNYYENVSNNVVAQSRHAHDAELRYRINQYHERYFYSNSERPRSYEEFRRDRGYDERHSVEDDYSMPWEQDGWGKSSIILSDQS